MRQMIRGIIDAVIEGAIKRITLKGGFGETIADREYFQHYGFTSRPLPGAEVVVIREGNHLVAIASDDRRYRIGLEAGEMAIYDDQGVAIHLKRDKHIHIYGAETMTVDAAADVIVNTARAAVTASESATVTSPLASIIASTKVTLDTPLTECLGDLAVAGGISSAGTYGGSGGKITTPGDIESTAGQVSDSVRSLAGDREIYNGHDHPGDSGGTTGAANQEM